MCKIGSPLLSFLLCSLCTPLQETFKERLGLVPMKTIIRTARERRPGALGYAEAMLLFYNKKCKYRLSMRKLYGTVSDEDDLDDDEDSDSDE